MTLDRLFRFLPKIKMDAKNPQDCWEWQGHKMPTGYGQIKYRNYIGTRLAHRLAYEHWRGPIVNVLHHTCGNTSCVNPWHLEDVTNTDHVKAHFEYINAGKCKNGHELVDSNVSIYESVGRCRWRCRVCARESTHKSYIKNREKRLEYDRVYRARRKGAR